MIRARLYQKYYLFTAVVVLLFIIAGFLASRVLLEQQQPPPMLMPLGQMHTASFYAHLIDSFSPSDREKAISEILAYVPPETPTSLALIDGGGKVIFPKDAGPLPDWPSIEKPARPYESVTLDPKDERPSQQLVRFGGAPAQYLYVVRKPNPHHRGGIMSPLFIWTFASLVVSVMIGIGFALFLLARSLREDAKLADRVLADMQRGNLKARFPIGPMDEIGQIKVRFNKMADEIERLINQLRGTEQSRTTLLQDLAHDLRTPVASLKNLLSMFGAPNMDQSVKEELHGLAMKEAEYFERLVEDLLVLSQVGEPRYKKSQERVALDLLVSDEAETVAVRAPATELKLTMPAQTVHVSGDSHLLRRMIRNALDNAFSFASSEVSVELRREGTQAVIVVSDNGSGFSKESLSSYGDRRVSRVLGSEKPGQSTRLSVGLGSVILKTIAEIHGGTVQPFNRTESGQVHGAEVRITLPTA